MMMTQEEAQQTIDCISYKPGWMLTYAWGQYDKYIQWRVADSSAPNGQYWHCRKWRLSPHMTVSEVVQTAFMAALAAEEHKCREAFTYRGVAVLGPHWDLEQKARQIEQGLLRESVR